MLPYTQIAYGEETRLIAKEKKKITISQFVMVPNPRKLIFKVEGLCCATEVEHLQSVLSPLLCGREITLSFVPIPLNLIAHWCCGSKVLLQHLNSDQMKRIGWLTESGSSDQVQRNRQLALFLRFYA